MWLLRAWIPLALSACALSAGSTSALAMKDTPGGVSAPAAQPAVNLGGGVASPAAPPAAAVPTLTVRPPTPPLAPCPHGATC